MLSLLDLCCGAGLASDGYVSVGFAVTGVDNRAQPAYPYPFRRGDVLELLDSTVPEGFDAIHVSAPCQPFTRAGHLRAAQSGTASAPDLLTPALARLRARWSHKPWVVENVPGAPGMGEAVRLCGSAFWLGVQRHRLFLSNVALRSTRCAHDRFPLDPDTGRPRPWGVYHTPADRIPGGGRTARDADHARDVMGIRRRLSWDEAKQGFPPAYTAHVGADLLLAISRGLGPAGP